MKTLEDFLAIPFNEQADFFESRLSTRVLNKLSWEIGLAVAIYSRDKNHLKGAGREVLHPFFDEYVDKRRSVERLNKLSYNG